MELRSFLAGLAFAGLAACTPGPAAQTASEAPPAPETAALAAAPIAAPDFTPVENPAALGFDPAGLAALDQQLDALAAAGARPGYAAIIARGTRVAFVSEAGAINLETGEPFTIDSPVRIASMSKPVTAVAVMMLVEAGQLGLDDPVSDYIPEFADVQVAVSPMANADGVIETRAPVRPITIRHLLTHTAGLGYIFDNETDLGRLYLENSLYSGSGNLEARMQQLAALPLYTDPGTRWIYSYSLDVLGRVIEVVSGEPFEVFMENRLFEPLGMSSTGFFYEDVDFDEAEMSPVYVHDESGAMVPFDQATPDWASGGGGLVSTASDYIRFAMMLANGGALGEVRILSPETVHELASPQVPSGQLGEDWGARGFGFGGAVALSPAEGQEAAGITGDYSWSGLFDTDFFISPNTGVAAVLMTQIQPGPNRPEPRSSAMFRPLVYASFAFD
ncbi:serine hydrolase domain-containing protein [Maricaulis sp.]|uniref:serine hydrolase domain-containing protein n=1 Tax=Maricaulis sp. TaxID=1486257 RepID=UPI003A94252A